MSTENSFTAARRFLENNDLPLTYIDQVAQFIEKNTAGVNIGGSDDLGDPFTGKIIPGLGAIVVLSFTFFSI